MKILIINSVCGFGSTGRICMDLAEIYEEQGHTVKIAYGREQVPDKAKKYAIRIGNEWDVHYHALQARIFDSSGFGSRMATRKFIEWIRNYKPDVIHLHNLHGYYIQVEMLFHYIKNEFSGKIIWTFHDCWPFTGHCAGFELQSCDGWKNECRQKCPMKRDYPQSNFLDRAAQNYQRKKAIFSNVRNMTIVTPSAWLANQAENTFFHSYPIRVIPNGIDLNIFKRNEVSDFRNIHNLQNKFILLGVANGLGEQKGLYDFIRLSAILDERFQIVLVGCYKDLKKEAPQIITIPRTKNINELISIYSSADVFLNLTLLDNFPTVNLEALACGLPIITYNTGGSPEALTESCGLVVKKHDLDGTVQAIEQLYRHPISKEQCRKRACDFEKRQKFLEYAAMIPEKGEK